MYYHQPIHSRTYPDQSSYPTGHLWWRAEWEDVCYPPNLPAARIPAMWWARTLLLGHAAVFVWSVVSGNPLVFILISLGPFYNGWLFYFCNSSRE